MIFNRLTNHNNNGEWVENDQAEPSHDTTAIRCGKYVLYSRCRHHMEPTVPNGSANSDIYIKINMIRVDIWLRTCDVSAKGW